MPIIGSRSCEPDAERHTQCVRSIPNAQFAISTGSAQEAHDIRTPHDGCGPISEHYFFWFAHGIIKMDNVLPDDFESIADVGEPLQAFAPHADCSRIRRRRMLVMPSVG